MVSAGGSAAAFARLPLWVLLRVWRCKVLGTLAQPGRSLGGPWTQGPPPLRSRGAGWSTSHVLMEAGGAWTGAWVGWGSATARNPGTAVQWVGACQWKAGPCTGQQLGQQGLEGPVDRRGSGTRERVHSAPRGWLLKERGPRGSSVGSPVPSAEMKHWGQAGGGQDLSAGKAGAGLHVAWGAGMGSTWHGVGGAPGQPPTGPAQALVGGSLRPRGHNVDRDPGLGTCPFSHLAPGAVEVGTLGGAPWSDGRPPDDSRRWGTDAAPREGRTVTRVWGGQRGGVAGGSWAGRRQGMRTPQDWGLRARAATTRGPSIGRPRDLDWGCRGRL